MVINRHIQCPVCDMSTDGVQYPLEYHKMFFHFCSEQCRETFRKYPELYIGKRAKDQGEVIKSRRLRLAQELSLEISSTMTESLKGLMGVKEIHLKGRLHNTCA